MNADSILFKESHFSLKGFETVRFDWNFNKRGGLAICIKNIYEKINLNFNSKSLETGSVIVDCNLGEILITICYKTPNNNISQLEWCDVMHAISQHGSKHFIMAGDFNAHHPSWDSDRQCINGKVIAENLDYENFILLNKNSHTHITMSNTGCSFPNIDLTFASPDLALMSEWQVLDDTWGSDHFPIFLEFNAEPIYKQKVEYKYKLHKVDWKIFYNELNENKHLFNSLEYTNLDTH